jgi:hypothetical protein
MKTKRKKKCKEKGCEAVLSEACIRRMIPRCMKCHWAKEKEKKQKQLIRARAKRLRKKDTTTRSKKEADKYFSLFIRKRDRGQCYTCGLKRTHKKMQNGHYEPRQHLGTRYCEINCHCQCYACNVAKKGNYTVYALNLQRDYGVGILEELNKKRNTITKLTKEDYKEIAKTYKEKYEKLIK